MKTKTIFVCQECGTQSPRWVGKCSNCDGWNTFVEENNTPVDSSKRGNVVYEEEPVLLSDILVQDENRILTNISEFDSVIGGGIVLGSVTLIGGDPGIGKSTLSLQVGCSLGKKGVKVLYVSGEESVKQTMMRAKRLSNNDNDSLYIVNQIDLKTIIKHIEDLGPDVVVIDSIQVVSHSELTSTPGSVSQVRECAAILTHIAKTKGISLFIIGHVTKEGLLAGPRVLEHIVDTVLYFEGERYSTYRVLRATKNRFGSTNEIGVFEMTSFGLKEVPNPSEIFLSERPQNTSGSVVIPIMEGTRPFLVEIQGLVSRSTFGVVRQKAQGFDANRLALLIAVLDKRLGMNLGDKDVFLNVVGGVRVMDPAADLAVSIAIASALLDRPIPSDTVVFGEVGLSSEVRSVSQVVSRVNEAQKLGFKKCIIPKNNLKSQEELRSFKIEIIPVETVKEALEYLKK
ncbi:MAG: DNA repair protein RadA [Omnitrophica WOR_2 bacterium RIFOXYB2_FULL_38_16]|nr:MAG: DNA repair protein RadA [Omnitrophica WOR_2 bacterium RIFOXYA2_FULL_38_17]OGX55639.1 MAG: DNA repair protein RadA [Omnitrophica WOR_2 bacterium RIFOXYC2_FULL_38_12]OGX60083.1 MAG: DNA repair protein RadA [Omnitrophica WOR_2 bacterium RIFOXYB2_FULL_38_16]HBG61399.1 DNA repair protein RadA [Candidatus Omnitrophota bacterium]